MRRLVPAVLASALLVLVVASGLLVLSDDEPAPDAGPVLEQRTSTVLAADFEGGLDGWEALGPARVEQRPGDAHGGAASLVTTARAEAWNGAALDVTGLLTPGTEHAVSVWVRLAPGSEPADLQLTVRHRTGDETTHDHLVSQAVTADAWTELRAAYTLPGAAEDVDMYVESLGSLTDFLVDDVLVTKETPPVQTDVPPLADAFPDGVEVGTAVARQDLVGAPAELLTRHFTMVTPENALKPASVQPREGEWTFERADEVLDLAVENDLRVYGHTLVWHRSTPDWFFEGPDGEPLGDGPEDRALLLARLEAHMRAIRTHLDERYGDADPVWAWDVVNEAVDPEQDDGLRRNEWYRVLGPGYVADAFRIADEVFGEDTLLFLNDYDTESPAKRQAVADIVRRLLDEGVPIDGVGHQMHVNLTTPVHRIEVTLDTFAELGVRQAITELDVSISATGEVLDRTPPDRLAEQGRYYRDVMDVVTRHAPELESVSFWGLYDTRSWLRTWPRDRPFEAPLLFDDDLQAKPAFWGVVDPSRLG